MSRTHLLDGRAARPPAAPLQRPTWVEVDLGAITANARVLRDLAPRSRLMAVVKADGYGHGMVPVARAALAGGADWLAVALVEEGRALRDAGISTPVLVLTEPPLAAIPALLDAGLTPTVYSPGFICALDAAARERGGDATAVHLELDTGMRRVGVPERDWSRVADLLAGCEGLRVSGLWSHFACADEPGHPSVERQSRSFRAGVDLARDRGLSPDLVHMCNSAGTLTRPDDHHGMVRCGIALYGLDPGGGVLGDVRVRPAMRWLSHVSLVKRVAAGEAVSYGHVWSASRDTTVVTVPAGYADGVTRSLGGCGEVVIGGVRRPMVGRVTMDQFLVDVGDDTVAVDDEVVLLGGQGDVAVTVDDWACWLDTITYEVVTTVGGRVPRVYHRRAD
ncbi:MAG TPA: alanine racemase [Euzebyales bacterium]|nr:alanine racemase [Euzebyales bacterium]